MARTKKNNRWDIDPDKLARALRIKRDQVPRVVVFELGRRVMRRTPVQLPDFIPPGSAHQSGNLRINWRYGENLKRPHYDASSGTFSRVGVDDAGQLAGFQVSVNNWRMGTSYAVLNGAPYGGVVEFGGYPNPPKKGSYNYRTMGYEIRTVAGFSKQAPKGMVRVTIGEFQGIVAAAARAERAKGLKV